MTNSQQDGSDHVIPPPIPPEDVGRYSVNRDPAREAGIARYVEIEAEGETVLHVELVKEEIVVGERYEIWDVTTDQERWWVITNLTNLYPQKLFRALIIRYPFT